MLYIYDILLNFNEYLIEFFNWSDEDNIKYIKKIPLFKVSNKFIKDIIFNNIKIDSKFLEIIKNKCLFFNEVDNNQYVCLFSDGNIAIGVNIIDKEIKEVSRMLLDEEEEVLNVVTSIDEVNINYEIISKINRNINISMKYLKIKNKLENEFTYLYNKKDIDKLGYYYYEYFNILDKNIDRVYNNLIKSLVNINDKHIYLYKIVELSYQNKIS